MEILLGFFAILSGISILLYVSENKRLNTVVKNAADPFSSLVDKKEMVDGQWKCWVADGLNNNGEINYMTVEDYVKKVEKRHQKQLRLFSFIWVTTAILLALVISG